MEYIRNTFLKSKYLFCFALMDVKRRLHIAHDTYPHLLLRLMIGGLHSFCYSLVFRNLSNPAVCYPGASMSGSFDTISCVFILTVTTFCSNSRM